MLITVLAFVSGLAVSAHGLATHRVPLLRSPSHFRRCSASALEPAGGGGGGGNGGSGVRINKVFTTEYSRRESDRLVAGGRVCINGAVAVPGDRVTAQDEVTLDGKPFAAAAAFAAAVAVGGDGDGTAPFVYLKYWKPRGITCTTDRRIAGNIIDALGRVGTRLFPVGRLDKDSEGLILMTNDGRLPNAIGRAAHAHGKLYLVDCARPLPDTDLRRLANGVVITTAAQRDNGPPKLLTAPTLPCAVRRLGPRSFSIVLTEGRNRQIRKMCEAIGHQVLALIAPRAPESIVRWERLPTFI